MYSTNYTYGAERLSNNREIKTVSTKCFTLWC